MRITRVFVVRDPSAESEPVDCLWEQNAASQGFADYIVGSPRFAWGDEHTALWTDPAEAIADMEKRFGRLRGGIPRGYSLPVAHDGAIRWVRIPGDDLIASGRSEAPPEGAEDRCVDAVTDAIEGRR